MENEDKKADAIMNKCVSSILFLCYITALILIIIWIFKLHNNAKNEPKSRITYITEDPSIFYKEEEFCYETCEPFVISGAIKIFDIPIQKIKKFCKALISTIFISIGSFILGIIFHSIAEKCDKDIFDSLSYFPATCCIFGVILSIIFAIILMHYYSKGNYSDFEEFSRCRFLSKQFRKDYDFIFKLKNEYKMPFAVLLIMEFFNFIKLVGDIAKSENS